MRKLFFTAAVLLALPLFAQAQDAPKVEIFGGYSYLRANSEGDGLDLHGWNASAAVNFTKWAGIVADFSGHYGDVTVAPGVSPDVSTYLFLLGPRFSYRKHNVLTPFGHVLLGVSRLHTSYNAFGTRIRDRDSSFAMAIGGGLDAKVHKNLAIRLFQADYVLTTFDQTLVDPITRQPVRDAQGNYFCGIGGLRGRTSSSCDDIQHNFRLSTGLVLRLGEQ